MLPNLQSPSTALFELVREAFNNPGLARILEACGSIFAGEFFIWEYDEEESMFYAINPFKETIYLIDSYQQSPKFGTLVLDEDDIELVYKDIFEYLVDYKTARSLVVSPADLFFQLVESIQKNDEAVKVLKDVDAFIKDGYLVWPCESDSEKPIYMAANPNARLVYELDNPNQDPVKGILIFSDSDYLWLARDLNDFTLSIAQRILFGAYAQSPHALYVPGAIWGIYHSLS